MIILMNNYWKSGKWIFSGNSWKGVKKKKKKLFYIKLRHTWKHDEKKSKAHTMHLWREQRNSYKWACGGCPIIHSSKVRA